MESTMEDRPLVFEQDPYTRRYRAKHWGLQNGFYGTSGGWIYRERNSTLRVKNEGKGRYKGTPKPVCQGWDRLYGLYRVKIESWRRNRNLYPYKK